MIISIYSQIKQRDRYRDQHQLNSSQLLVLSMQVQFTILLYLEQMQQDYLIISRVDIQQENNMDIEQNQNKLLDEQDEPYTLQNIPLTISIQNYKVSLQNCIIQIKEESYSILISKPDDQWVTLYSSFRNTTSVGISGGNNLLIFVGDVQEDDLQEEPQILKIIKEGKPCNLNLMGHSFIIQLSLEKQGKNVAVELNDIFTEYMGDADENQSLYDENEEFQQMISVDNIDQNGNIMINSKNKQSEQSEEDEQKMQEQIKDIEKKK